MFLEWIPDLCVFMAGPSWTDPCVDAEAWAGAAAAGAGWAGATALTLVANGNLTDTVAAIDRESLPSPVPRSFKNSAPPPFEIDLLNFCVWTL